MKKKVSILFLLMKVVFHTIPADSGLFPERSTVCWSQELGS
ncbi:hypothetical protein [Arsenophonus endosymbiont of Bemisia tabaci]|nr:hypothetical protein [Arsenophonus endosymbiont of Bemisia tabaci]